MSKQESEANRTYRNVLLGLGLDSRDGHVRITRGKNFRLLGGSHETHQMMQEKAVKFNEQLEKRRKTLDSINQEEFYDIARTIGLKTENGKNKKGD